MKNKRTIIALFLVCILMLSLVGCQKKDDLGTPVSIESKRIEAMPEYIKEYLEEQKLFPSYQAFDLDGGILLFAGRGEVPTGGYDVSMTEARIMEGKLVVSVSMTDPEEDSQNTQALEYPYSLGVVVGQGLPREVVFVDQNKENEIIASTSIGQIPQLEKSVAVLYFGNTDGLLVGEQSEFAGVISAERGGELIQRLIQGPQNSELLKVLPEGTRVVNYSFDEAQSLAIVDFSSEILSVSGSMGEGLAVYSVVNTLTSLPGITKVQFLVEGEAVESIGGHLFLREPIGRDESMLADKFFK